MNILWICADDFAADACGAYGNTMVRTPNLDRLAQQSIRFDRAYCSAPLSTPSRQSFLTGKYPWTIGVTLSPTPLPEDETTVAELLRQSGYLTAAFGKTHYYEDLKSRFDLAFDHAEHRSWLFEQKTATSSAVSPETAVLPDWRPFCDDAAIWLNSMRLPYADTDARMYGTYLTEKVVEFLSGNCTEPFCTFIAFHETHSPFHFPVDFPYRCDPENIVPPDPPADMTDVPAVFEDLTTEEKQGIIASCYTSASFMDKNVGIILDALEGNHLADRTLVIFSSDHGYMLGQRGRFEKHCCYEPAIRVPLLLRSPDGFAAGSSCPNLVSLIDIAPTLLEFCEIELPADLPGRSLLSLLAADKAASCDFVVSHYSGNEEACLVEERWKVMYKTGIHDRMDGYATTEPPSGPCVELYDLQEDPDEMRNCAEELVHRDTVERMLAALAGHMQATLKQPAINSAVTTPREVLNNCLSPPEFWC